MNEIERGDLQHFGGKVRAARLANDATQQDLATAAGLSKSFLSEIENGKSSLSLLAAVKLADALGLSLDAMTGRELEAAMVPRERFGELLGLTREISRRWEAAEKERDLARAETAALRESLREYVERVGGR